MRAMASRSWLTARMAVPVKVRVRNRYSPIMARIASTKAMSRVKEMKIPPSSMVGSVTPEMIASDAAAFFDFLASRPEVSGDAFGVCGYCMGGRTSVIVAGRVPDRVAAAGSFHGGGLVTDDATSPHLLADQMKATVYVAGAENDGSFTPEQAETLDKALTAAGVTHTVEFYPAAHGFAVPDNPPYDEEASERHWIALQQLLKSALPN